MNLTRVLILLSTGCIGFSLYALWIIREFRQQVARISIYARQQLRHFPRLVPEKAARETGARLALVDTLSHADGSLREQIVQRTNHLRLLTDINEQFKQDLSLQEVARITVEAVWRSAEIDFVAVLLGEGELGPYHYAGVRGVNNPLAVLGQVCNVPLWGVLAQALVKRTQYGEPDYLVIEDIASEGRPKPGELAWDSRTGSLIILPMRYGSRTLGAIVVGSCTAYYFQASALRYFLSGLAASATRAVQEVQSRLQSNQWSKQLVSLQVLTHRIARAKTLDAILDALGSELREMWGDVTIGIFIRKVDNAKGATSRQTSAKRKHKERPSSLQLHVAETLDQDALDLLSSPALRKLVQRVIAAGQPLFVEPSAAMAESDPFHYLASGRGLLVPIGADETMGVIMVAAPERNSPFDESDMILMRTIANSAAMAVAKTQLPAPSRSTRKAKGSG